MHGIASILSDLLGKQGEALGGWRRAVVEGQSCQPYSQDKGETASKKRYRFAKYIVTAIKRLFPGTPHMESAAAIPLSFFCFRRRLAITSTTVPLAAE
jgi:hypothetical protein